MALDFAAGCAGGSAGILVGFPLDTVKVRIQTQCMMSNNQKYTGTFQCLTSIIKREGVKSLYRGMSSPLTGVAAMNAICFGVYGNVHRRLNNPDSLTSISIAAMSAGFVMAFVCSPMELVKTQMQVRNNGKGSIQTLMGIIREAGFRGLFRGLLLTVAREVPANTIYFSFYEFLVKGHETNTAWVFTSGGLSGIMSWIFTYPLDVIKSRIQADHVAQKKRVYRNAFHCLRTSLQREGYGMLVRGIGSTVIRAFPVNATTMGVVTLIMNAFTDEKVNPHDTMARLRMAESLHLELPESVEKYFNNGLRYRHNVSTLATDGPFIVQIAPPSIAIAPHRFYMETVLAATPTRSRPRDAKDPEVGTFRAPLSLSALVRILTRLLAPRNESEEDETFNQMWKNHLAFSTSNNYAYGDVLLDNRTLFMVVPEEEKKPQEEPDNILPPSMLVSKANVKQNEIRKYAVTTEDLLQQTSVISKEDKIYGFYYLVS